MNPLHSVQDYTGALVGLLPTGAAWNCDADTVRAQVLGGLASGWQPVEADAQALVVDAFPATTVNLLPEWQSSLGLPDPCAGPAPALAQSQAQVVARLAGAGGQSAAFMEAYAAQLGVTVAITQYAPWRCGVSRCGQPISGRAFAYTWLVTAPAETEAYLQAVLQCELAAISPAHTRVLFAFV